MKRGTLGAILAALLVLGLLVGYDILTSRSIPTQSSVVLTSGTNTLSSIPVTVGDAPYGLAYDQAKNDTYVAVSGTSNIAELDSNGSVVKYIGIGGGADFLAYDPADLYVYAALVGNDSVAVIDTISDTVVAHVSVPTSSGWMAYDPANKSVYSVNRESNTVYVLSGEAVVANITLSGLPFAAAFDPVDGDMYLTSNVGEVFVVNGTSDGLLATVQVGGPSSTLLGAAYDPANGEVYVTSYSDNEVLVVNGTSSARAIQGFDQPVGIAFSASGDRMFVVNSALGRIEEVSSASSTSLPVGTDPREVVALPSGLVVVTNYGEATVSLVTL